MGVPVAVVAYLALGMLGRRDDLHRLSERPPATDPRLTTTRLLTLSLGLAMIPALLSLHLLTGSETDIGLVLGFTIALTVLVAARVVGLLRGRDKVADLDIALRDAGQEFLTAESIGEIASSATLAIQRIVGREAEVWVELHTQSGDFESTGINASTPIPTSASSAAVARADSSTEEFEVADALEFALGGAGQRGRFVVSLSNHLEAAHQLALQTMASQLSMAVSAVELREAAFRERSSRRLRALVEQSADLVTVLDEDRRMTYVSPNALRILGYTDEHLLELDPMSLVHSDDYAGLATHIDRPTMPHEPALVSEARLETADGSYRWFDVTARDFRDDAEVGGLVITARDVTEERAAKLGLKRSEQWFRGLVQNSSDMIAVLDQHGVFTYASPAVENILGVRPEDVQGRNVLELLPDTEVDRLTGMRHELVRSRGRSQTIEVEYERPDSATRTLEVTITDRRDDPSVNGLVLNIRDITDRKQLEQDLRHQVLHDDLTGLGSRVQFTEQLQGALGPDRRPGSRVAVLFIDIDDFKNINDSLGHAAGDQVLLEISSRLQNRLRLHDRSARFGGDEFAVILTDVYGESDATIVADRVVEELGRPVNLLGQEVRLSVSVGIAIDDHNHPSAEDLLRAADVAMYEAKDQGKGRWAMFEAGMADETVERFEISNALGSAIDNGEMTVHYQPIVDLATGEMRGLEALVRWQHPERGMVSPASFIPVAEQNGLIIPLGRSVLSTAVRQLAEWRGAGHDIYVSVNVSAVQLQVPGVVDEILSVVDLSETIRSAVVLELTESALISDFEVVMARIDELRAAGLRVAIDDFGTGYSTLRYADEFSADILKIDRSFVSKLERTERSTIVSTILTIAAGMGAETVAEGIEVPVQHTRLLSLGCRLGQGYYFTRPSPAAAITELLDAQREGRHLAGHTH